MASPQTENGYTMIANELLEALAQIRTSGEETQVFYVLLRKIYGFKKKEDHISLSQFVLATGIAKQNVCRALSKLITKKMIIKKDNDGTASYSIQKNYRRWKPLSKKIMLSKKIIRVIKKDNSTVIKKETYKRKKNTKETITKETSSSEKIFHPDDIRLTQLLIDLIQKNDIRSGVGELTEKQQENWINSCRLLREKNKRTVEEIEGIIRWCQQDDFWMTNILSMPKLRKQFDQLFLKAGRYFMDASKDGMEDWLKDPNMGRTD